MPASSPEGPASGEPVLDPAAPVLGDQFASLERQGQTRIFGMWVFLVTELLLFAGLFTLYAAYRAEYPVDFAHASSHNNAFLGTLNTVVLITSSFTVAFAISLVRIGAIGFARISLAVTIVLALGFLVIKGVEYGQHFEEGIYPGRFYACGELPSFGARMFFTVYYLATLLHALHVIAGMTVLSVVFVKLGRGRYSATHHVGMEMAGLYWHVVDIIWIFLWPLLYLLST